MQLPHELEKRLLKLGRALVDQQAASPWCLPEQAASGFWFGGGNATIGTDGAIYVVGRYRNAGDSRTGVAGGPRGLRLSMFRAEHPQASLEPVLQLQKEDLQVAECQVLSIEGAALHWGEGGPELFVSTEKTNIGYPAGFEDYLKPGTGVWTVDRIVANELLGLASAPRETILRSRDPDTVHVKDPAVYMDGNGDLTLIFCTHPFTWTSSNTGYAVRHQGEQDFTRTVFPAFARGDCWDVAMTRVTCLVDVPSVGAFSDRRVSLLFYDGGESIRNLSEHEEAVKRPRGYSCEELGGLAYICDGVWEPVRLSRYEPLFISPWGTGSSRYVDVLDTPEGMLATWQQSQTDGSQPLVKNWLVREQIERILS